MKWPDPDALEFFVRLLRQTIVDRGVDIPDRLLNPWARVVAARYRDFLGGEG